MKEIWKDIEGYENMYQISNKGRVKSLKRISVLKERILKDQVSNGGYRRIELSFNGFKQHKYIHRLVACAFIPKEDGKPRAIHLNGLKSDNTAENLKWCEPKKTPSNKITNPLNLGAFKIYPIDQKGEFSVIVNEDRMFLQKQEAKKLIDFLTNSLKHG